MALSYRLATLAQFVTQPSVVADIGTDHGYLLVGLAKQQLLRKGIAADVAEKPLASAVEHLKQFNYQHLVEARLGSGLRVLKLDENIDYIVIAGMGGSLIGQILTDGSDYLNAHPQTTLILQPNNAEPNLRQVLMTMGYAIQAERLVEEDQHRYEVLVARYSKDHIVYTERQLLFGPYLVEEKNAVFQAKWQEELKRKQRLRTQLEKVTPLVRTQKKRQELSHTINLIQEELG